VSGDQNSYMIELVDQTYNEMIARYYTYLDTLFYPIVKDRRMPLFSEELDDREVFLRLQEAQRKALLVRSGQMEPDMDSILWEEDRDGARAKYNALAERYQQELSA